MPSTFTVVTDSPHPPEELFDVSLDIDAHVASMSESKERAVAGVTTGRIGLGETVTWRARHLGVWFILTSEISEMDRPTRFVDRQVRGPFTTFVHEHRFEPHLSGSRMTDHITVGAPVFGRVVERLILVPYLRRLIAQRNAHLLAALR
ncbi:SRPBCC family protein [Microbacterium sp. CPCC 204701]|uniref:SRPBCC family protein n=1 Tax=Microbacterium sp. CPCC 204701 TaxID=2493084 RepID=UPI000FD8B494|nr:SRPBCC family protein [Microbacterium sp. CPCC 204701]